MKYPQLVFLIVIGSLLSGTCIAQSWSSPLTTTKKVVVAVQDAYFVKQDNKSTSSFVVNGLFPNSCYSVAGIKVDHEEDLLHTVRLYANVQQGVCMMVLIPFTVEGHLGPLSPGSHTVKFVSGDGTSFVKTVLIK